MSSQKQQEANRNNATKSTGPRTGEGKQRSSQNALKHGIYSLQSVIPGEDPAAFDQLCCEFVDRFEPNDPYERSLVRQMADTEWRLRRISRLEANFLEAAFEDESNHHNKFPTGEPEPREGLLLGRALQTRTAGLLRFARYEAHLSRQMRQAHQSLVEYRKQADQPYRPPHRAPDRSEDLQPVPAPSNPRDYSRPREPFYHPTGDLRRQQSKSTERSQFRPTQTVSTTSDPPDPNPSDENAA